MYPNTDTYQTDRALYFILLYRVLVKVGLAICFQWTTLNQRLEITFLLRLFLAASFHFVFYFF